MANPALIERLLRPFAIVLDGRLELGLEVLLLDDRIETIRPHTGMPEPYVLSPAFVNAHSHLEYRGLQGMMTKREYWPWIRQIMLAKLEQNESQLAGDCRVAAFENRRTGVALIGEHSDRPYSGAAIAEAGLRGVIFQEVITRSMTDRRLEIWSESQRRAAAQSELIGGPAYVIPHAYQTVDDETLTAIGASGKPFSMHVAETDLENQLTERGAGAIADSLRARNLPFAPSGKRLIPTLDDLGLVRHGAQFVHCCAIDSAEVQLLAERGVTVAHCPRSNAALSCPVAPVREMLDAGIQVGLGLDSAASSGPIDIFAEMRACLQVSDHRVWPEDAWNMATTMGAASLAPAIDARTWSIAPGSRVPLIKIHIEGADSTEALIEQGDPSRIEWL